MEQEDQSVSRGGSGCAGVVGGRRGAWDLGFLGLLCVWGRLEKGESETTGRPRGGWALEEKPVAASEIRP